VSKTCFANYNVQVAIKAEWRQCYVLFNTMSYPSSWGGDAGWDPTKAIKLQWDMPQPATGAADMAFDLWVDNVEWITDEDVAAGNVPTTQSECLPIAAEETPAQ